MGKGGDRKITSERAYQKDPEGNRLGFLIGFLRGDRGLSRSQLAIRIARSLPDDHPLHEEVTADWLRYIENGRKSISRQALEVISGSLECTPSEHLSLLIAADRNVLADSSGVTDTVAEVLSRIVALLCRDPEVRSQVELLIADKKASALTDSDLLEIWIATARLKR
jgi:hypothetical protein